MASSLAGNITGCQMISWFDAGNQTYKTYIVGDTSVYDFDIEDGYGFVRYWSTRVVSLIVLDQG